MPFLPMRIELGAKAPEEPMAYDGWRCLHTVEGGRPVPPGMPEERTPDYALSLPMTEAIQRMSYALMRHVNPTITPTNWTRVHDYDRCFNNGQGFRDADDPRANFITGENLDKPLPKYDKAMRVCGGTFIRGNVVWDSFGQKLECIAGVHGINADQPLPDPETIIRNHWFTYAVSVNSDYTKIAHFPQGNGGPVLVPFIFRGKITFPLAWFEKWVGNELPDPLRIYR